MDKKSLSYEYIRGLVDGEGCFTFSSSPTRGGVRAKIPSFALSMTERDLDLINLVKSTLNLRNKIYVYGERMMPGGYIRKPMATLIVRDLGQLKNIIVPLFYNRLHGHKRIQFENWIKEIDIHPLVPESYKIISLLCRTGFYRRPNKFNEDLR